MLRDITTTYNVWNIDEKEYQKIANAIPGENQELPEKHGNYSSKSTGWIAKKFIIRYDYSIQGHTNVNMRFKPEPMM